MRSNGSGYSSGQNRRPRRPALYRRHLRERRTRHIGMGSLVLLSGALVLMVIALAGVISLVKASEALGDIPRLEDQNAVELAETSRIYAADGSLLAYLHAGENRTVIPANSIPRSVKDATVAIEDERFYEHRGVDLEGVVRSLVRNVEAGSVTEGFSTITMQLVGNLYLDRRDISFSRKVREMSLAWQLERKLTKDEILSLYLNTVFFGANAYGIQAAARTYFDKDPADLTLAEAALIAGLPQAPTDYSPRSHPEAAKIRRNQVLRAMLNNDFISKAEYDEAVASPVELAKASPYQTMREPYVVAYVRKQLIDMFGENVVFNAGLRVETTINPNYQRIGREVIAARLNQKGDPSAALVAVDTRTGYIRAMVGGSDYDTSKFNLAAQGRRQAGSAFKTFALVAAIEMGIDPYDTYYESMPVSLDIPGSREPWNVSTYGGNYYGSISLAQATLRSDNTVYAQLALDVTAERIVDVAHRMGIRSSLNANPAIVLGGLTYGVSPLEMASAYGTLANLGKHMEPVIILRVKDHRGNVLWEAKPKATQAISQGVAAVVNDILYRNTLSGTGTRAALDDRVSAGKTGTAQDWADAWYCGYTPQVSTAVWVGHPQGKISMYNVHGIRVTGGSFPAMIWHDFMSRIMQDYPVEQFRKPDKAVVYDEDFESPHAVKPTSSSSSTSSSSTSTTGGPGSSTTVTEQPTTDTTRQTSTTRRPTTTRPPTTEPTTPPTSTPTTALPPD